MYDFELNKSEKIKIISDDTIIYNNKNSKEYTCIITNERMLILDYPSVIHNSMEDLRITGKMNYVRRKEVVLQIKLKDITKIKKEKRYYVINLKDGRYFNISNNEIIKTIIKINISK